MSAVLHVEQLNGKRPLSWSWPVSWKTKYREKRERERPIFLGLRRKPIKPVHRTCTAHRGTGRPLEEVFKARWEGELGRLPRSEELAMENKKEPQPPGFWHQKCRVRELEKLRFRRRTRLALYKNRLPLKRPEGAAVRLAICCPNLRNE